MLPSASWNSAGSATPGTVAGGPFEGPLTCLETGLTFLRTTRAVNVVDATATLQTGGALAQGHAYLLCVGNITNVVAVFYSGDLQAGSAQRHSPNVKIPAGVDLLMKAVQFAGAAEASTIKLYWA